MHPKEETSLNKLSKVFTSLTHVSKPPPPPNMVFDPSKTQAGGASAKNMADDAPGGKMWLPPGAQARGRISSMWCMRRMGTLGGRGRRCVYTYLSLFTQVHIIRHDI